MSIRDKVHQDLVAAMKARNEPEKGALRLLMAALTEAEKQEGKTLGEADELKVVAKKLKEASRSIEEYDRLGQPERVRALEVERDIYQRYAPQPMAEQEVAQLVDAVVRETGASSPKDMGKVMPAVMAKLAGRADGAMVKRLVQERLTVNV